MSIQLNGINCFYGAHQALFDITLDCPQGETLVLLGPSGAGKSSLLRVLNLLEMPRSGTLNIAGNHFDFTKTPSDNAIRDLRRNVGMVFQQYNLWPHLTVQQNLIEAPCRVLGLSKDQALAVQKNCWNVCVSNLIAIVTRCIFLVVSSSVLLLPVR